MQKNRTMKDVRDAEYRRDKAYNQMEKVKKELNWFKRNNGLLPPDAGSGKNSRGVTANSRGRGGSDEFVEFSDNKNSTKKARGVTVKTGKGGNTLQLPDGSSRSLAVRQTAQSAQKHQSPIQSKNVAP